MTGFWRRLIMGQQQAATATSDLLRIVEQPMEVGAPLTEEYFSRGRRPARIPFLPEDRPRIKLVDGVWKVVFDMGSPASLWLAAYYYVMARNKKEGRV